MLSIYLHIPFCLVRCAYCDFNTYAGLDDLMPAYAGALAREVRLAGSRSGGAVEQGGGGAAHTVFFGGGTPSLMPLPLLSEIFVALRDSFNLTPDCEITLEANPGTVDLPYLQGLRALGVNRLSFGVQSAQPSELQLLDRLHSFEQVIEAVRLARSADFGNLNLDLIYGLPHQSLAMWQDTLARTLQLESDHLSLYALSLEHGTPMRSWVYRGLLPMPDPDLAADMYEWASETLRAAGFVQYEISNWSRKEVGGRKSEGEDSSYLRPRAFDFQCRHNLQYWLNLPYLGFGAGAHGYAGGFRYSNVLSPRVYVERLEGSSVTPQFPFSPALRESHPVDRDSEMGETMMMGMRLIGVGVRERAFQERFGIGLGDRYGKELRELKELKLVEWDDEGARLTEKARLVANRVFMEFV
ncbi:MAG: radical SAM family heme chaperone HemW [Chloroflexi bacterium]|nr:radical SAM family heme chaperone HemW [Chloroflexota bacterium]